MKVKSESEIAQPCLTLCDPMDFSLPGSSIHGIFQARVLEWGAIAFSITELAHFTYFVASCIPSKAHVAKTIRCLLKLFSRILESALSSDLELVSTGWDH